MKQTNESQSNGAPDVDDRRHAARLPQDVLLKCNLGTVRDLSKTGMRIHRKGMPKQSLVVVCLSDGNEEVELPAEVVWVKKLGFRNFEMGLQFTDLPPEALNIVSRFAMYNRYNRSM